MILLELHQLIICGLVVIASSIQHARKPWNVDCWQ
jgi:hypothetical protein